MIIIIVVVVIVVIVVVVIVIVVINTIDNNITFEGIPTCTIKSCILSW